MSSSDSANDVSRSEEEEDIEAQTERLARIAERRAIENEALKKQEEANQQKMKVQSLACLESNCIAAKTALWEAITAGKKGAGVNQQEMQELADLQRNYTAAWAAFREAAIADGKKKADELRAVIAAEKAAELKAAEDAQRAARAAQKTAKRKAKKAAEAKKRAAERKANNAAKAEQRAAVRKAKKTAKAEQRAAATTHDPGYDGESDEESD